MDLTIEQKIKRYHSEEIMLILFICSTDLSNYSDTDLENFAECIEGRIEVLFEPNYLLTLDEYLNINKSIIEALLILKKNIVALYSSGWINKMRDKKSIWGEINVFSIKILKELNITYVEPITFIGKNLNIDWTY